MYNIVVVVSISLYGYNSSSCSQVMNRNLSCALLPLCGDIVFRILIIRPTTDQNETKI